MKYIILLLTSLLFLHASQAKSILQGSFPKGTGKHYTVYLKSLDKTVSDLGVLDEEIQVRPDNTFTFETKLSNPALLHLIVVSESADGNKSNIVSVVYLEPGKKLTVPYSPMGNHWVQPDYSAIKDRSNRALLEVQARALTLNKELYDLPFDPIHTKARIQQFYTESERILASKKINSDVQKYIRFYSFDQYNTALYRFGMELKNISESDKSRYYQQAEDPVPFFNDELVLSFYNGVSNIVNYLNLATDQPVHSRRKSLTHIAQQNQLLQQHLFNTQVKDKVLERMLNSFGASYRAENNFEEDLKTYTQLAQHIQDTMMRGETIKGFENLRYTLKGAKWPDLQFRTADGSLIHLDQFKGQYVLIDVWASWCVPCIKMLPYLHELEQQYKGQNIAFIALSIDADKTKWQNKTKELKLGGHQLLDQQGAFAKKMNITGIPHYILYDPEGKLVSYKTALPNNPELKKLLDSML